MVACRTLLVLIAVIVFHSGAYGQERGPLSEANIEKLLRAGVTPRRMVTLIEEHGVKFEVTEEVRERLKKAGADAEVMEAVEKAGVEFARKRREEAGRGKEKDRGGSEAQGRRTF